MLAAIGFIGSSVLLGIFAYTFASRLNRPYKLGLENFSLAYFLLACAFASWGIGSAVGGTNILKLTVVLGDLALLAATVLLLRLLVTEHMKSTATLAAGFSAAIFVALRVWLLPLNPQLSSGVLLFNSPKVVSVLLGLILAFVWLPANMKAAKRLASGLQDNSLNMLFSTVYIMVVLISLYFLASRERSAIILSFAAMCITFIGLIGSTIIAAKLYRNNNGR